MVSLIQMNMHASCLKVHKIKLQVKNQKYITAHITHAIANMLKSKIYSAKVLRLNVSARVLRTSQGMLWAGF